MAKCSEYGGKGGEVECDCTSGCGRDAADDDCVACGGVAYILVRPARGKE